MYNVVEVIIIDDYRNISIISFIRLGSSFSLLKKVNFKCCEFCQIVNLHVLFTT